MILSFSYLLVIIFFAVIIFCIRKGSNSNIQLDTSHINEDSFQRYAKFFGSYIPTDDEFIKKLNSIYIAVIKEHDTKISSIAKKSKCSTEECVLKIRYLKNKRVLGDFYIDTLHDELVMCSEEDSNLIEKYKPYIYHSHLQIDEIANILPNKEYLDINAMRDKVFEELNYLDNKGLLNGLIIDDVDKKITYYTIEKKKTNSGFESVHCPNCGALCDVQIDGKSRCNYCNSIVNGSGVNKDEV